MKRKLKCVRQTNVALQIFERFFVLKSALHCMHARSQIHMYVHTYIHMYTHAFKHVYVCTSVHSRGRSICLQAGLGLSYLSRYTHTQTHSLTGSYTLVYSMYIFMCVCRCLVACIRQLDLNFNGNVRKTSKQWQRSERVLRGQS